MSKLFFDDLIDAKEIEAEIKKIFSSKDDREEAEAIVDSIFHDRAVKKILDRLPPEHHPKFLELYFESPYDEVRIFAFLRGKTDKNIEEDLREEFKIISSEILKELRDSDEVTVETRVSKK
jgi:hypothetical protein